jgi:hypothetical protein
MTREWLFPVEDSAVGRRFLDSSRSGLAISLSPYRGNSAAWIVKSEPDSIFMTAFAIRPISDAGAFIVVIGIGPP